MNILIAGDFCPKNRVVAAIEKGDYETVFGQIRPIVGQSDYSIVNFECPVRTSTGEGIKKAGPSLKCSVKAVDALQYAGFNCVTLANNHFYDQGEEGVRETVESLSKVGIAHVGGGYNFEEASKTFYQEVNGKTLAIINCCEHEFSIATEKTGGSNPLNPIRQYNAIRAAKEKADYVLVIVHGGIEHYQYPTHRMVETYRFFIDAGADAVVNHHQHCFSGYEVYRGKPIFYGLGNFCFDWPERSTLLWEEGFMVMISFGEGDVGYKLFPYNQNGKEVGVRLKDEDNNKRWKNRFDAISNVIVDEMKLNEKYEILLKKTERNYSANLTPYTGRFLIALYMRHLLPMFMPKRKLRVLLNMIMCESHRDRMIHMLRNYSK